LDKPIAGLDKQIVDWKTHELEHFQNGQCEEVLTKM